MPLPHVIVEDRDRVRRIVLNRGPERNLLTPAMMDALLGALDAASAKVIVIAATGPAFCAGHDMKTMARHQGDPDGGRAYFEKLFAKCAKLMQAIAGAPQPVIAEVHAPAVAAGCQLVAACDLAVASKTAIFGTTGVAYGLYCSTPAVPLTRTVPPKFAAEMLMTGDTIDAQWALQIGLVTRLAEPGELTGKTVELAERIVRHSGAVLALGKSAVKEQASLALGEAYAEASAAMVENLMLADGREGLAAFAEKRPARWQDR